jgi:hypothetical protein
MYIDTLNLLRMQSFSFHEFDDLLTSLDSSTCAASLKLPSRNLTFHTLVKPVLTADVGRCELTITRKCFKIAEHSRIRGDQNFEGALLPPLRSFHRLHFLGPSSYREINHFFQLYIQNTLGCCYKLWTFSDHRKFRFFGGGLLYVLLPTLVLIFIQSPLRQFSVYDGA